MNGHLPPHEQEEWQEPSPPPLPPREARPGNPLWALVGVAFIAGAIYQLLSGRMFGLFPMQVDGVAGIAGLALGAKAELYLSSALGSACGAILIYIS